MNSITASNNRNLDTGETRCEGDYGGAIVKPTTQKCIAKPVSGSDSEENELKLVVQEESV